MKKIKHSLLIITCVSFIAGSVTAQDKGQKGLVIAYPTSVGFIWNVSDRIAIRPDVTFTRNTSEQGIPVPSTPAVNSYSIETGFSALFYVKKWQDVSAYVAPRFSYSRSKTTNSSLLGGSTVNWSYPASASFGVQYTVNERFGVFGEAGLEYIRFHSGSPFSVFPLTKTWKSKSGVGVVFYF